jgi:hypothetical protein
LFAGSSAHAATLLTGPTNSFYDLSAKAQSTGLPDDIKSETGAMPPASSGTLVAEINASPVDVFAQASAGATFSDLNPQNQFTTIAFNGTSIAQATNNGLVLNFDNSEANATAKVTAKFQLDSAQGFVATFDGGVTPEFSLNSFARITGSIGTISTQTLSTKILRIGKLPAGVNSLTIETSAHAEAHPVTIPSATADATLTAGFQLTPADELIVLDRDLIVNRQLQLTEGVIRLPPLPIADSFEMFFLGGTAQLSGDLPLSGNNYFEGDSSLQQAVGVQATLQPGTEVRLTDGSRYVLEPASQVLGKGGAGILAKGGGSIISSGAGGVLGKGGAGVLGKGSANILGKGGASIAPSGAAAAIVLQEGDEWAVDLGVDGSIVAQENFSDIVVNNGGELVGDVRMGDAAYPAHVSFGGSASPGHSPGVWQVVGDLNLTAGSGLQVELGGTTPGTGFDWLDVNASAAGGDGRLTLAGAIELLVVNGFETDPNLPTGEFAIITAEGGVTGQFANVGDGQRLPTSDGLGSFVVDYRPDSVVLMDFQPVPEPHAACLLLMAAAMGLRCRRSPG